MADVIPLPLRQSRPMTAHEVSVIRRKYGLPRLPERLSPEADDDALASYGDWCNDGRGFGRAED